MHRSFIPFCLLLCLATSLSAQSKFPYQSYLNEKVRDPHFKAYLEKQWQGKASPADLEAIEAYYQNRRLGSSKTDNLIQEGAEPHIVIHPTNPNILALSFMQNSLTNADYPVYISIDGGITWTKSSFSTEATLSSQFQGNMAIGGGDPILAFDRNGTLHMSYIYLHGNFPSLRADMFYVYSTDTGQSFTVPPLEDHVIYEGNLFQSDLLDRQWMEVDNTGGPYDGNLYLSAFYLGGALNTAGQIILRKSPDSTGFDLDSLSTAVVASPGNITQFGNVKVDQQGRVHVSCAYMDENTGGGFVYHTLSTDGGKTFTSPSQVGTGQLLSPLPGAVPGGIIHERENAAVSLAVDGDNVYLAWTDMGADSSKAYFSYSNDAGATFSPQFEFGNLLLGRSSFHFMPNVAADSGHVSISWYAVDKTLGITNYYVAESGDSGKTFRNRAVLKVSDTSSTFVGGANTFYGDYNSSIKSGCNTWTVWSDGRSGAPDIYVAKTRLCDSSSSSLSIVPEVSPVTEEFQVGSIWPNPAVNWAKFDLQISSSQIIQTELFDLQGKLLQASKADILPAGSHEITVNVNELSAGEYLLKVTSNNGLFATRLFIKE